MSDQLLRDLKTTGEMWRYLMAWSVSLCTGLYALAGIQCALTLMRTRAAIRRDKERGQGRHLHHRTPPRSRRCLEATAIGLGIPLLFAVLGAVLSFCVTGIFNFLLAKMYVSIPYALATHTAVTLASGEAVLLAYVHLGRTGSGI
ncbi:MAG: hypothetical protein MHM6MM_000638 [Cercozoa sp. M6MM]